MGLIGNYSIINKSPGRSLSGPPAIARSNYSTTSALRNSYLHFGKLAAYPSGYYAPYSWAMPINAGIISSFTSSFSELSASVNLAGGRNLEALTALSVISSNAQLDQIVTFIASSVLSIVGSGDLNASVNMQANAVLALTTNVNIQAIVDALASSSMTITPSSILTALAHMNAEAGGPTPLSPEGLAVAVWETQINALRAGELVALLSEVNLKILELHKLQGLDASAPVTVTESGRIAGSITQNFTGDGISTTTVTRV